MSLEQIDKTKAVVSESLKISFPAWPLQNTVAVNPFWFKRNSPFEKVLYDVEPAIRTSLLLPIDKYRDLFLKSEITKTELQEALLESKKIFPTLPETTDKLIEKSDTIRSHTKMTPTFADFQSSTMDWSSIVTAEVGKFAAAYLDENQSLAVIPGQEQGFWQTWIESQEYDRSMESFGIKDFKRIVTSIKSYSTDEAISKMLNKFNFSNDKAKLVYLNRLVASVMGWFSQFRYIEWQQQLGYAVSRKCIPEDLVAVRLAYDYVLLKVTEEKKPEIVHEWLKVIHKNGEDLNSEVASEEFQVRYVFQLAWEFSYQRKLAEKINTSLQEDKSLPEAQLVFCIDVRSEMIRRHIEQNDSSIQTLGFAGFFGIPFDFKPVDEKKFSHRLPVLLKPAYQVTMDTTNEQANDAYSSSYFKNLRKHALSSFTYVELFGVLYAEKVARRAWLGVLKNLQKKTLPDRFSDETPLPSLDSARNSDGKVFALEERVARAAAVLRHMGLTSGFANLVIIVGHGSETTNNAFGSSLDCGACGGHAGDANSRFLVQLLNDPLIREGLKAENIDIPNSTHFVSAIHETVTDEIYFMDQDSLSAAMKGKVEKLSEKLKQASQSTRLERQNARSEIIDSKAFRRAHNWSEVRPEWGLAGNACFIVAPRKRTKGSNFSSRSFLHDYDWKRDKITGYQTLELIMTAPMVVTNWINMQYYASTVAPNVYGSGSKVLHNLVNESGVIEGNNGDLRVGLPLQSVHDGEKFVHEPLRLSVVIEAPREEIESIINKHQVVRELVENEWLHLLHIEPETLKVYRRKRSGEYSSVLGQ